MKITLNGIAQKIHNAMTIDQLLIDNGYDGKLVAVAVNHEFTPKTSYATTTIKDGDTIEIVAPMQGG